MTASGKGHSVRPSVTTMAPKAGEPSDADWWRRYDAVDLPRPHQAALHEFVKFGYHGTTIRRIAAAAGMSVPGLYYHFRSKEEILATLLKSAMADVVRRRDAAVASASDDPRSRFVVQVQHFCLHTMYRLEEALMIRELRVLEDPDLSTVIALRDDLETTFFADIADGVADGTFHLADPRSAGRAVLALCRSIAGWYSPEGPATPEEIAVEYVAFALRLVGDRATVTSQH